MNTSVGVADNCVGTITVTQRERPVLNISVDRVLCGRCGTCQQICPEVFLVSEGAVSIIGQCRSRSVEENCLDAMEDCPAQAIHVGELWL